jgi:cell division inhibitor SepF
MRLNPDDEDDFYNEEYDYDDEYDDRSAKNRSGFHKKEYKEEKADNYVEEKVPVEKPVKKSPKVTPIRPVNKKNGSTPSSVCVIKPTSVEDAREITETLLNDRSVILNVEGLNVEMAQRIIDFTAGSCFAISGNLQKVSNYIFIITPADVELSGDFMNLVDSIPNGLQTDF